MYKNTSEAVDYILRGWPIRPEIRKVEQKDIDKVIIPESKPEVEKPQDNKMNFSFSRQKYVEQAKPLKKIYLYAVSRTIVEKLIERLNLNAEIIRNVEDADIVIAHKNFAKGGAKILSTAKEYRVQIFYVKTNSMAQIQKVLKDALDIQPGDVESLTGYTDETEKALDEAKAGIKKILDGAEMVDLEPQTSHIRKLQHELIEQYNLQGKSIGEEPNRHLRIER